MNFNFINRDKALGLALGSLLTPFSQAVFQSGFALAKEAVNDRVRFPMLVEQIEYFRNIPDKCSPQVRDTIADWNSDIRFKQSARLHVLTFWQYDARWKTVRLISLPVCNSDYRTTPLAAYEP